MKRTAVALVSAAALIALGGCKKGNNAGDTTGMSAPGAVGAGNTAAGAAAAGGGVTGTTSTAGTRVATPTDTIATPDTTAKKTHRKGKKGK